jgi:very-short-patch-repair endonuclease
VGAHDVAVGEVAASQYGAFTPAQAMGAGMPIRTFRRRVANGIFLPTRLPEVYRLASSEETWHQRLWVAHLWGGEVSAISHASAGALYVLDEFEPGPVELSVPRGTKHVVRGIRLHQARLRSGDVRVIDGLRVTSPERTLLDIAATRRVEVAEDAAEDAFYKGLTIPEKVLGRIKGQPGSAALRQYIQERGDGRPMARKLERAFWRLMRKAGLAKVLTRQFEVRIDGERFFIDAAAPDLRLAFECDGLGKRTSRSATNAEYRRQNLLILNGWTVVRFTWDEVMHDPDFVVHTVREAMATAQAAREAARRRMSS